MASVAKGGMLCASIMIGRWARLLVSVMAPLMAAAAAGVIMGVVIGVGRWSSINF